MSEYDNNETPDLVMEERPSFLSAQQYDRVKFWAQYVLPGLATLYVALAGLWELPYALQVAGTITAIDTALGMILGISKTQYDNSDAKYDGEVHLAPAEEDAEATNMRVRLDPNALFDKNEVLVRVRKAG